MLTRHWLCTPAEWEGPCAIKKHVRKPYARKFAAFIAKANIPVEVSAHALRLMGVAWSPRHDAPSEYPWSKTEHAVLVSTTWVCPRLCLQCGWSALPLSGYAYGWYLQVTLLAPIEKKTNTTMMLPAV